MAVFVALFWLWKRWKFHRFLKKAAPIIYAGFLAEGVHLPDNQNTVELVVDVATRLYKEIEKRGVDKPVNSGDKK